VLLAPFRTADGSTVGNLKPMEAAGI